MEDKQIENIRHSLAHLLAAAVLKKFPGTKLGIGPTIENGFYYDFLLPQAIAPSDLKNLEKEIKDLIKHDLVFEGKEISAPEAKELFKEQSFKLELINELEKSGEKISIYETKKPGSTDPVFIDLCRGGHIETTKEIDLGSFKLDRIAGAYWHRSEESTTHTHLWTCFRDQRRA